MLFKAHRYEKSMREKKPPKKKYKNKKDEEKKARMNGIKLLLLHIQFVHKQWDTKTQMRMKEKKQSRRKR